jgi:hypothetical protein
MEIPPLDVEIESVFPWVQPVCQDQPSPNQRRVEMGVTGIEISSLS